MKKIFVYAGLLIAFISLASTQKNFTIKSKESFCDKRCNKIAPVMSPMDFNLSPVSHFLIGI